MKWMGISDLVLTHLFIRNKQLSGHLELERKMAVFYADYKKTMEKVDGMSRYSYMVCKQPAIVKVAGIQEMNPFVITNRKYNAPELGFKE